MFEIIWNAIGFLLLAGLVASVVYVINDAKREAAEINAQQYLTPEERHLFYKKKNAS